MVVVIGRVPGITPHDATWGVGETIPDRRSATVLIDGALYLITCRC